MKNLTTKLLLGAALIAGSLEARAQTTNVTVTVTNNATMTWHWQDQYQLNYAQPANGSITGTAPNWYDANGAVNLTAAPTVPAQYQFSNWSGVPSSLGTQTNNASISFNMDAPYTPVANFALRTFNLTVISPYGTPVPGSQSGVQYGTPVVEGIEMYVTNSPGRRVRNTGATVVQ